MKSKIAPPTDPAIVIKVDPLLELLSVEVPVWNLPTIRIHSYIAIQQQYTYICTYIVCYKVNLKY